MWLDCSGISTLRSDLQIRRSGDSYWLRRIKIDIISAARYLQGKHNSWFFFLDALLNSWFMLLSHVQSIFSLTFEADLTGAGYNLVALALGGSMQDNAAKAQYIKHVQRL